MGNLQPAILLVGPTGSGKTPLGDYLEKTGFAGCRCFHFDFGENLRRTALRRTRPAFLSASDFNVVKSVLKTGALLAENDFHIARHILEDFIRRKRIAANHVLILNGLPRHKGQAEAIESAVHIHIVINLVCSPEVVMSRIKVNSGGDRTNRRDDRPELVRRKLGTYRAKTLPLLDHYRAKRVKVVDIAVTADSDPAGYLRELKRAEKWLLKRKDGEGE